MAITWRSHCYEGPCQFSQAVDWNGFSIQTDTDRARASWLGETDLALIPGMRFTLQGRATGAGTQHAVWFDKHGNFMAGQRIDFGDVFSAPVDAAGLRIDLRLWRSKGLAQWELIQLSFALPEEDEPPVRLPIPPVAELQAHRVSGYKWGRNFFLIDHEAETGLLPQPADTALIVTGYRNGREISLEIGWPFEDEDE